MDERPMTDDDDRDNRQDWGTRPEDWHGQPVPACDGTVAVEDVVKWMRLKIFGWGGALAEEFLAEFSPASTGDREGPNPGTGHGQ